MGLGSLLCDSCLPGAPGSPISSLTDVQVPCSLRGQGKVPVLFPLSPRRSSAGRFWVTAAHQRPCLCSFPKSSGLWPSARLAVSHIIHKLYTPSLIMFVGNTSGVLGELKARQGAAQPEKGSEPSSGLGCLPLSFLHQPWEPGPLPSNHKPEHAVQTCSHTAEAWGHYISPK